MAKKPRKPYPPWRGAPGGGPEVWRKLAEARLGGTQARNEDLDALGLAAMPTDLQGLKTAYRKAMLLAHPDLGGNDDDAIKTSLAYARLLQALKGAT